MSSEESEDLIVPTKWYDALPRKSWERFEKVETSHPWFEVYKLPHDVYAIYEPGQFQEVISYLAIGEEKAALVDTGYGMGDIKGLAEELTEEVEEILEEFEDMFDDTIKAHAKVKSNSKSGKKLAEKIAEINERILEVDAVIDTTKDPEEKSGYESRIADIKSLMNEAVDNEGLDGVEDLLEELEEELGIEKPSKNKGNNGKGPKTEETEPEPS